MANLLGTNRELSFVQYVKQLRTPSTYFIHCDLVDPHRNLLNGKASTLLATFDIRGRSFEKVHYETSQQVFRVTASGNYENSVTLTVKDSNGEIFDFNGLPLLFELEIN